MMATLIFILILSLLIIVHEFGHFIAARINGVRVEQFSLGFGPQIFKKKKGDTEYSISLIPLGGYVKMSGDNQAEYKGKADEYLSKAPGRRFQIIFFGPFLNYVLGFLFFWGLVVIADSPLFSTLVAQNAPEESRGTSLTIVNCIGFSITIISIQFMNALSENIPAQYLYMVLAIGPVFGLIALLRNNIR